MIANKQNIGKWNDDGFYTRLLTKSLSILSIIILCGFCVTLINYYLTYPYYGNDTGYYLSIVRELDEGNIYFKDIATSYNPLAIFVIGIPYFLFGLTKIHAPLIVNYIAISLSAFFLYKILRHLKLTRTWSLILVLLFILHMLLFDGGHIILEPITIMFQLISMKLYLQFRNSEKIKHLFFSGLFLGLAFLSKQYALFLLLPVFFDSFFIRKHIKHLTFFVVAITLPVLFLGIYYLSIGTPLKTFFKYVLGLGVNYDEGLGSGQDYKFTFYRVKSILKLNGYLFIIPLLLLTMSKKYYKESIFFILMGLSALSVFYFAAYRHYYQFLVPFFIILFGFILSRSDLNKKRLFISVLFLILAIYPYSQVGRNCRKQKALSVRQQEDISVVKKVLKSNSEVYLSGPSPMYYYVAELESINLSEIGFTFPGFFSPERIVSNMQPGAYIVLGDDYLEDYIPRFSGQLSKVEELTTSGGTFSVYIRN